MYPLCPDVHVSHYQGEEQHKAMASGSERLLASLQVICDQRLRGQVEACGGARYRRLQSTLMAIQS